MSARTTLSLDDDVAAGLEAEGRRRKLSFEETVNEVLRRGLGDALPPKAASMKPYRIEARPLYARPGVAFDDIEGLLGQIDPPASP